jgi:hypothetical protein
LGSLFTLFSIWLVSLILISSVMDFFLSNTIVVESLSLNTGYKNNNLFMSAGMIIPSSSSFCSNTNITSIGFGGQINTSNIYDSNTTFCKTFLNCTNCALQGFTQQICYDYKGTYESPAYSPIAFYDIKLSSIISDNLYKINGSILNSNQIMTGDQPTIIVVSLFRSVYKVLIGYSFAPIIHLLDFFIPVIKDPLSYGMVGHVVEKSYSTSEAIMGTGFQVCYSFQLSPTIYYLEQQSKQSTLNFLAQIFSLSSASFILLTLFFNICDRFNKFIIPKIKKKKKIEKEKEENVKDINDLEKDQVENKDHTEINTEDNEFIEMQNIFKELKLLKEKNFKFKNLIN